MYNTKVGNKMLQGKGKKLIFWGPAVELWASSLCHSLIPHTIIELFLPHPPPPSPSEKERYIKHIRAFYLPNQL